MADAEHEPGAARTGPATAQPAAPTQPAAPSAVPSAADGRRRWLLGAVAVAAAAAGAGLAAWRLRPGRLSPAAADAAVQALWQMRWQTPEGQALPAEAWRGGPLVLNFWATWCPPCIEEMPLLDAFFRENAASGLKVLGLAVDQAPAVQRFLARLPVSFPVAMAGLEGSELARSLGNTSGGLPFSVLLGADGSIRQRKIGQLTLEILAQWKAAARG